MVDTDRSWSLQAGRQVSFSPSGVVIWTADGDDGDIKYSGMVCPSWRPDRGIVGHLAKDLFGAGQVVTSATFSSLQRRLVMVMVMMLVVIGIVMGVLFMLCSNSCMTSFLPPPAGGSRTRPRVTFF